MRRLVLAALAAASIVAVGPRATAHADEIASNPQCQRMWDQLATPVATRMMTYVQAADAYPMQPNGRPPVGAYPGRSGRVRRARLSPPGGGASWQLYRGYLPYGLQQTRLTTAFGYPGAVRTPGRQPVSPAYVGQQVVARRRAVASRASPLAI